MSVASGESPADLVSDIRLRYVEHCRYQGASPNSSILQVLDFYIKSSYQLVSIILSGQRGTITGPHFVALFGAIAAYRPPTLSEITISDQRLTDDALKALSKVLSKVPSIRILQLTHCHFSARGIAQLWDHVGEVEHLNLSHCGAPKETSTEVGNRRTDPKSGKGSVAVSGVKMSGVDDAVAQQLCRALVANRSIQRLDLSHGHITAESGEAFVDLIRCNSTIQHINLSWNKLTDKFIEAIVLALCNNSTLSTLQLSGTQLRFKGADLLVRLLQDPQSRCRLRRCNVEYNSIGSTLMQRLKDLLAKNREKFPAESEQREWESQSGAPDEGDRRAQRFVSAESAAINASGEAPISPISPTSSTGNLTKEAGDSSIASQAPMEDDMDRLLELAERTSELFADTAYPPHIRQKFRMFIQFAISVCESFHTSTRTALDDSLDWKLRFEHLQSQNQLDMSNLHQQLHEHNDAIKERDQQCQIAVTNIQQLHEQCAAMEEEMADLKSKLQASEAQCSIQKHEIEDKDSRVRKLQDKLNDMSRENLAHQASLRSATDALSKSSEGHSQLDELRQYIDVLEKQLIDERRSKDELLSKVEKRQHQLTNVLQQLEDEKALQTAQTESATSIQQELSNLARDYDELRKEADDWRSAKEEADKRVTDLSLQLQKSNTELEETTQALMEALNRK